MRKRRTFGSSATGKGKEQGRKGTCYTSLFLRRRKLKKGAPTAKRTLRPPESVHAFDYVIALSVDESKGKEGGKKKRCRRRGKTMIEGHHHGQRLCVKRRRCLGGAGRLVYTPSNAFIASSGGKGKKDGFKQKGEKDTPRQRA